MIKEHSVAFTAEQNEVGNETLDVLTDLGRLNPAATSRLVDSFYQIRQEAEGRR